MSGNRNTEEMTVELLARRKVTAWLAGLPPSKEDPNVAQVLLTDMLELLQPYGVTNVVRSNEPRAYRCTKEGMNALESNIRQDKVTRVIASSSSLTSEGTAVGVLSLGQKHVEADAPYLSIEVSPKQKGKLVEIAENLSLFVRRWFDPFRCVAGFVSIDEVVESRLIGSTGFVTYHEYENALAPLMQWPDVSRFARGAFWGNALGSELCEQLGGQEQVLKEAPAAVREILDRGVWLQLSRGIPPSRESFFQLSAYLSPILRRDAGVHSLHLGDVRPFDSNIAQTKSSIRSENQLWSNHHSVPIRYLGDYVDSNMIINIHVMETAEELDITLIIKEITTWYQEGFDGRFALPDLPDSGFHFMSDLVLTDRALRCEVDFGLADSESAIRDLGQRLSSTSHVEAIVIGVEEVG